MPILVPDDGDQPTPTEEYNRFAVNELIDETLNNLSGWGIDDGQITWLTAPLSATALSFTVDEPQKVTRGIVEIGNELVWVKGSTENGVQVAPFGRGFKGTKPEVHSVGTQVVKGPKFPRHNVLTTINDVIESVYPQLYGIGITELEFTPVRVTYELPDSAVDVLSVRQKRIGPSEIWEKLERYAFNDNADSEDFPTGKSIDIYQAYEVGQPIQVIYMKRPTRLLTGDVFTNSGLQQTAWPCILYGVLHRMVASLDIAATGQNSARAAKANQRRFISSVELSREYYAVHQQLLREERDRLERDFPATNNFEV
jgi:hypothetical protein